MMCSGLNRHVKLRMCLACSFSVLCLLCLQGTTYAQGPLSGQAPQVQGYPVQGTSAKPESSVSGANGQQLISRLITLEDTGFADGVRIEAGKDIFFSVPARLKIKSAVLTLDYEAAASFDGRQSIEVQVNGRTMLVRALASSSERNTLTIPLTTLDVTNGTVRVGIRYTSVFSDNQCVDNRLSAGHLTILPSSALAFAFDPSILDDTRMAAALMPMDISILLPRRKLNETEYAAALIAASGFRESGRRVRFETYPVNADQPDAILPDGRWKTGYVVLAADAEMGSVTRTDGGGSDEGNLESVRIGRNPALMISGRRPDLGAAMLNSSWLAGAGLANTNVRAVQLQDNAGAGANTLNLTFDQIPADLATSDLMDKTGWNATIRARDLPFGTRATGLKLDVAIAPDGQKSPAVVTAFINGQLAASRVSSLDTVTRVDVPLADGLAGLETTLRVMAQRQPAGGDCQRAPMGFPAQLLPSSQIVLSAQREKAADFYDLPSRFRNGVVVHVDQADFGRQRDSLGLLTEIVRSLVPARASLSVKFVNPGQPADPVTPFIALTALSPGASSPPVRFDQGQVVVRQKDGRVLLDMSGADRSLVAQIVETDRLVPKVQGLWLHPPTAGNPLIVPARLRLDRGNLAFIDRDGVSLSLSSERERLVQVAYPDHVSWLDLAETYRPWIIGALWLLVSLIFLVLLQRFYALKTKKG